VVRHPQQGEVEVEHRQIDQAAEVEVVLQVPQNHLQEEAGEEASKDRHALEEVVEGHQAPQSQAAEAVEGEDSEMM
jgi:hypothetical protein